MTIGTVRVRFAPRPTGYFPVGGARTALYNYLFSRHHGGRFILRVEDTDQTRYQPDALPDLLEGLRWLGWWWDEGPEVGGAYGPYYQSDRVAIYREYADKLLAAGKAYHCYCSPERLEALRQSQRGSRQAHGYDRHCRHLTQQQIADYTAQGIRPVVRLMVPEEGSTSFDDVLRGHITIQNSQLDDLVLLKSDGFPTYHLANVVDDHLMEITHIMRGEEWISSVPRHVLLYQALGWPIPVQAHLPTILDPSGHGKLSKRKKKTADGRQLLTYVHEFRRAGYLPEALTNFLALVGWSYDDKTEFLTRDELIQYFDLPKVSKAPSAFSYDKLEFMNASYIRALGRNDLAGRLLGVLRGARRRADMATALKIVPLVQERLKTLNDVLDLTDFLFADPGEYGADLLIQKGMDAASTGQALRAASECLAGLPAIDEAALEAGLRATGDALGLKPRQFFGCLRVALTGKTVTPPLFGSMEIIGREGCLRRLAAALGKLAEA
ncbi:MAG: glutamate--tRNA ligase [Chloroflexota bacterium]